MARAPEALTAKQSGAMALSLRRGTKLLASGRGQMIPGSAGLRITLPTRVSAGTATLRVSFAASAGESGAAAATTLHIRLAR